VGAAGGVDNAEGSLNFNRKGTEAYGNQAELAKFKVNRIVGKGEALKIEDFMSSK